MLNPERDEKIPSKDRRQRNSRLITINFDIQEITRYTSHCRTLYSEYNIEAPGIVPPANVPLSHETRETLLVFLSPPLRRLSELPSTPPLDGLRGAHQGKPRSRSVVLCSSQKQKEFISLKKGRGPIHTCSKRRLLSLNFFLNKVTGAIVRKREKE